MLAMSFQDVKAFLIERYHLDAATASEQARLLMQEHHYIEECPKVFTRESLGLYLDRMEQRGG